mmetsp:Transcript_7242/g.9826  ORF Transcript_7242/g.9826 Transcript_7242/m.9826 type:complete len:277 (-) Transcript_7242:131-961(-)
MTSFTLFGTAITLIIPVVTSFVPLHQRCSIIKLHSQTRQKPTRPLFFFFPEKADDTEPIRENASTEIDIIEKEVLASTQARLDMKRVTDVLLEENSANSSRQKLPQTESQGLAEPTSAPPSPWTIALAAALVSSLAVNLVLHSWIISAVVFVFAFLAASGDPLDEEGIAGSIARIVGRSTLKSVDAATPKIKAVARAAVTGDEELESLRGRLLELEQENAELRLWVQRRKAVDESLSSFTLEQLKGLAREKGIMVGGTKSQLLMRLVEEGGIDLTK